MKVWAFGQHSRSKERAGVPLCTLHTQSHSEPQTPASTQPQCSLGLRVPGEKQQPDANTSSPPPPVSLPLFFSCPLELVLQPHPFANLILHSLALSFSQHCPKFLPCQPHPCNPTPERTSRQGPEFIMASSHRAHGTPHSHTCSQPLLGLFPSTSCHSLSAAGCG